MNFLILEISEPSSKETPLKLAEIKDFLEKELKSITDINALNESLLKEIAIKSSKHKFIVQSTKLALDNSNVNLDINTKFTAAWESERDGYITIVLGKPESISEVEQSDDSSVNPPVRRDTIGGILDDYITIEQGQYEKYLLSIFYIYVG